MNNKNCIFPFKYKGETHNKCTTAGSDNSAAWCATEVRNGENMVEHDNDMFEQVDEDGEVVRNTWEDCDDGCPGTSILVYVLGQV